MTTIGLSLVGIGAVAFYGLRFIESDGWNLIMSLAAIMALAAGAMLLSFQVQYTPPPPRDIAALAYVPIAGSPLNAARIEQAHELFAGGAD